MLNTCPLAVDKSKAIEINNKCVRLFALFLKICNLFDIFINLGFATRLTVRKMVQKLLSEESRKWVEKKWRDYSSQIYKLCEIKCKNTENAKDLFQTIALKFCQNAKKLQSGSFYFSWMSKVMRNSFYDMVVDGHLTSPVSQLNDVQALYDVFPEEKSVFFNQAEDCSEDFEAILQKLSAVDRLIVELFYIGDISTLEIANILGISQNAVRKRRHFALKQLREILKVSDWR